MDAQTTQTNDQMDPPEDDQALREMANKLGFFTERDFMTLAGATLLTVREWGKRGTGPTRIRLGRNYFYDHEHVREFMQRRARNQQSTVRGASLL